ncbi:MAG: RluA family pseudouridine synthase, partial [Dehalococcoidia bacterium]
MKKVVKLTVDTNGVRLDKFIGEKYLELSRTYAKKLIEEGHITVNGKSAKASLKLRSGDLLSIRIPSPETSQLTADDIPLKIIYEDSDLLVVDKPSGLTVHPAPGNPRHTLVNAILARFPNLPNGGDVLRPGIVHRLDKDTSGLILVAKNRQALNNLSNQFKKRSVTKTYLVLVKGQLSPRRGFIEAPIGRNPHNPKRMAVVENGRDARTEYSVLTYVSDCSLLEIKLETGRTHQIRVHLSAIGYPVVGDITYGVKSPFLS